MGLSKQEQRAAQNAARTERKYQIKYLEKENKDLVHHLNYLVDTINKFQRFSSLIRPKRVNGNPDHPTYNLAHEEVSTPILSHFIDGETSIETYQKVIKMQRIVVELFERDELGMICHVIVGHQQKLAYYVSDEHLQLYGLPVYAIAEQLNRAWLEKQNQLEHAAYDHKRRLEEERKKAQNSPWRKWNEIPF